MHKQLLVVLGLLCLVACQSDQPQKTSKRMALEKTKATHVIEGQIESIRLQNINKARGHYTYNVDLIVVPTSITPPLIEEVKKVTIRVERFYWSRLDEAQQKALAPDGPQSRLAPKTYKNFSVGQSKQFSIKMTSPGTPMPLGMLIQ